MADVWLIFETAHGAEGFRLLGAWVTEALALKVVMDLVNDDAIATQAIFDKLKPTQPKVFVSKQLRGVWTINRVDGQGHQPLAPLRSYHMTSTPIQGSAVDALGAVTDA